MGAAKAVLAILFVVLMAGYQAEAVKWEDCSKADAIGKLLDFKVIGCSENSTDICIVKVSEWIVLRTKFKMNADEGYKEADYEASIVYDKGGSNLVSAGHACYVKGFKCPGEPGSIQKLDFESIVSGNSGTIFVRLTRSEDRKEIFCAKYKEHHID